jgi:hypothetical protein
MCIEPGCKTRAVYNTKGQPKASHCAKHKKEGMINLISKPCVEPGCTTCPIYNTKGLKPSYCYDHKTNEMVDVKHKSCIEPGCKTCPSYNIEGTTERLYCLKHKLVGMVNVKHKKCVELNCIKQPFFNIEGLEALYCLKHKTLEMINIISNKCVELNCKKQPLFNTEGLKQGLYCFDHKTYGMVDVINKKCVELNCTKQPSFNKAGDPASLYCFEHKKEGMINVKNKTCKTPLCYTIVKNKYEGYCLFCFINTFPDKPVARNYKTKEFAVVEHIKTKYTELSWREDKKVQDGCSRRRPDLLLDLGYQIMIIEIDENQHIDYDCSCENKRMMEISQDLGHRPIIFIRFNPDDYLQKETTVSSCWGNNKNGICVVKKTKQKEWNDRLHALENQIDYWINPDNMTDKTIEIVQLFYDI